MEYPLYIMNKGNVGMFWNKIFCIALTGCGHD